MRIFIIIFCAFFITACQTNTVSKTNTEETNKTVVVDCLDLMFNQKKLKQARVQCFGDIYIQHSPRAEDGPDHIINAFAGFFEQNPKLSLDIKRSAADGDLVWVHSHMKINPDVLGDAVVDIFRVKDHKIIEHWSAMQPVAEQSSNSNTMF